MAKEERSLKDIAYQILKQEEKTLHYKIIANRALKCGLIENDNLIIAGNISSAINADIRQCKIEGKESKFIYYGKGKYGLTENEPKGIFASIRDNNNSVKEHLLENLHKMSPFAYEELVGEVLKNLGFENIEVTSKSGDGGIDVKGELVVAGSIKNNVCVQVKRWKSNVQRANIAELRGSIAVNQTGLFITTSDFSKPAIEEANDPHKAPISLINGKEFVDILCEYGIGVTSEEVVIYDIDRENGLIDISEQSNVEEKGIEIFADYKGQRYFATYFSPTKITYNGENFTAPSPAGKKVRNGSEINGWDFWKYIDEKDGKTYKLSKLREK